MPSGRGVPWLQRVLHMGPDVPAAGCGRRREALLDSPLGERLRAGAVADLPRHRRRLQRLGTFLAALCAADAGGACAAAAASSTSTPPCAAARTARRSACCWAKALRRRVVLHVHSGPGDVASFRAGLGAVQPRALPPRLPRRRRRPRRLRRQRRGAGRGLRRRRRRRRPQRGAGGGRVERRGRARRAGRALAYLGGFANPAKGGDVLVEALRAARRRRSLRVVLAGPGELPGRRGADRGSAGGPVGAAGSSRAKRTSCCGEADGLRHLLDARRGCRWRCWRRWPTGWRSSPPRSAASPRSSATASRRCSSRRGRGGAGRGAGPARRRRRAARAPRRRRPRARRRLRPRRGRGAIGAVYRGLL